MRDNIIYLIFNNSENTIDFKVQLGFHFKNISKIINLGYIE